MNQTHDIDNLTIPLANLRKIVAKTNHLDDSTEINLEFVLASLFPTVWDNIQKYAQQCYTQGYIAGKNEGRHDEN